MQVTLEIEDNPVFGGGGFYVECKEHPLSFSAPDHVIMKAIQDYEAEFEPNTRFRYHNADGSARVAGLIRRRLRKNAVQSKEGLQRLSANAVAQSLSAYPSTMLSNPKEVTWPAREMLDSVKESLSDAGIIFRE